MNATLPGELQIERNGPLAARMPLGKNNDSPTLAHGRKHLPVKLKVPGEWEDRARQADYDLGRFAAACGVSKRRLQQLFRQHWKFSPHRWLRQMKLTDVVSQLPEDCRLKEVFPGLGYANSSIFCQKFRNAFGFTPGRFLRQYRTVQSRLSHLAKHISLYAYL